VEQPLSITIPQTTSKSVYGPAPVPQQGYCSSCHTFTPLAFQVRDSNTPEREAWVYTCMKSMCLDRIRKHIEGLMRTAGPRPLH
jgi:hypothetical protein